MLLATFPLKSLAYWASHLVVRKSIPGNVSAELHVTPSDWRIRVRDHEDFVIEPDMEVRLDKSADTTTMGVLRDVERLLDPIANIAERIHTLPYGGPPSPLLAVQNEARQAREARDLIRDHLLELMLEADPFPSDDR